MKSKRIQELDDALHERARTRQQRVKKATIETEQKPTKQKPVTKAPKPATARKRSASKDYEPQDRPRSKLNARRAFLSKINEVAQEKVKALFDSCFEPLLKLTRISASWQSPDSEPMTEAEYFPIDWLELDEEKLRQIAVRNSGSEETLEWQDRVAVKREFCERLIAWGHDCSIEEKWFLEFGWRALLRYWQDTKPKIQESKPDVLGSKAKAPPVTEQPRRNLVNAAEHDRARAIVALQSDAPLPGPPAMPSPRPQIGPQASEVVFALKRKAWRSTLQTLEWERDAQMTSPEARLENKFWTCMGMGFFITAPWMEKPEALRLKPPQPPKGLPPIAEEALGRVRTRKEYEDVVRIWLDVDFKYGITALVPEEVRKKWAQEAFSCLEPHIDAYWREYGEYLKAQGWVEVKTKKALSLHCEWLVRFVVSDQLLSKIAETVDRARGISEQAISDAIRDVASLAGVTLKERRGRKSS